MRNFNIQREKIILIILAFLFFLPGCDLFKPARDSEKDKVYKDKDGELAEIQGRRVYNPETGKWEIVRVVIAKLDTIKWVDLPPAKFPPITSDGTFEPVEGTTVNPVPNTITPEGSELKSAYNVAVLLPFFTNQFNESNATLPRNSHWAINFFSGMQMATQLLEDEGVNLNIRTLDTRGDETEMRNLLRSNPDLSNADLIIGPYRRNNVRIVADFAKEKNKTFVSPYTASMNISMGNSNYIQVSPSLKSHCEAITKHVLANYDTSEVVVVARDVAEETERVKYIQDAKRVLSGNKDSLGFREFIIKDESADFHNMDILPYIKPGGTTVFIVPSYRNETFIYSFLRNIAVNKPEEDRVVVYGLQPWMNYERIDFDFFENLNVHVSSGSFADDFNPEIQLFKRRYFEKYGMPPKPEVFAGHDVMLFFGRMLKKHGTKFQLYLEQEDPSPYLQTRFDIERVVVDPNAHREDLGFVDYWENKFVHILRFSNYHFQPAD